MGYILVCDDERSICQMLQIAFQNQGHRVETVTSGEQACRKIDSTLYDIVVTDVRMPHVTGMEVLQHSRRVSPDTMVIVITAVDDSEIPIEALNAGAFYYIRKGPKLLEDLLSAAALAMDRTHLRQQNAALKRDAAQRNSLDNLIGESEPMRAAQANHPHHRHHQQHRHRQWRERHRQGTGRPRHPHLLSPLQRALRQRQLRSLPGNPAGKRTLRLRQGSLHRSQLPTSADSSNSPAAAPSSSTKSVKPPSPCRSNSSASCRSAASVPSAAAQETPIDVRVIAATNKNLLQQVQDGQFREDLYYRLSVIPVEVPPLRDRGEDVVLLANHFLKKFAVQMSKNVVRLSPESLKTMKGYDWPGNVRVLENTIERAVAMSTEDELRVELPNSGQRRHVHHRGQRRSPRGRPSRRRHRPGALHRRRREESPPVGPAPLQRRPNPRR